MFEIKCLICGSPIVTIDNKPCCLSCGWSPDKQPQQKLPQKSVQYDRNHRITEQAHKNLLNNVDGSLDYCIKRGMTPYTINEWMLGYIPENYELLPQMWHQRLLFPIMSNDGNHIIAFGSRKIIADDRPKYVNSFASYIYNKSESLYGYHLVPNDADTIYLCEGYVDVLTMDEKGFAYPVASLGTALTLQQAMLIREKAKQVVICFDSDEAGQKNALRSATLLAHAGFKTPEIRVLMIYDAKDVDEALQHGGTLCEESLLAYLMEREQYDLFLDALINH